MLGSEYLAGRQVIVYGAEAKRLAFLARIDADLQLTISRCDLFEAHRVADEQSIGVLASIGESAFVAYGRVDEGADGKLPPSVVDALSPEHGDLHRWAMTVRNKHVGHSVNAMNQTLAVAVIAEHGGKLELRDAFATNFRTVLGAPDIRDLRRSAQAVREALAPEMDLARQLLLDAVASEPSATYANPVPQMNLVPRSSFDYSGTRREVHGTINVPSNLEEQSYGDLNAV